MKPLHGRPRLTAALVRRVGPTAYAAPPASLTLRAIVRSSRVRSSAGEPAGYPPTISPSVARAQPQRLLARDSTRSASRQAILVHRDSVLSCRPASTASTPPRQPVAGAEEAGQGGGRGEPGGRDRPAPWPDGAAPGQGRGAEEGGHAPAARVLHAQPLRSSQVKPGRGRDAATAPAAASARSATRTGMSAPSRGLAPGRKMRLSRPPAGEEPSRPSSAVASRCSGFSSTTRRNAAWAPAAWPTCW